MDTELHLPWDNEALEALLKKIIQTGETTKVDFKRQLNITTGEHHAELLKDISAIANSYDYPYRNHGFIVLDVAENKLAYAKFSQNADSLQARVDELLKNYIEPFIPTQVRIFGSGEETWGVIVVPPTRTAPHVFVKEVCKRCRGDIFVRRGTTTDKATPSDYVRFFRLHLDEHTYELRQQLEDITHELAALKKQQTIPVKTFEKEIPVPSENKQQTERPTEQSISMEAETPASVDLLRFIDNTFAREEDPITKGIVKEAQKIQKFLTSGAIPWDLNHVNKEVGKQYLDKVEDVAKVFWAGLGNLAYRDEKGKYDNAIVRALSCLAQTQDPPTSVAYTDWGVNFRYFPLVVSLYTLFIVAISQKRYHLLKKVLQLDLSRRSPYEEATPLPSVLFYIRRSEQVFQTQHPAYPNQIWCDAVGSVIDLILQRTLTIDDLAWNKREAFFIGEFILCLTPLDVVDRETKKPLMRHPSGGLYLYFSEANPFIRRFLRNHSKSICQIFQRPLREILADFDNSAVKLVSGRCFGHGFAGGALNEAFPETFDQQNPPNK